MPHEMEDVVGVSRQSLAHGAGRSVENEPYLDPGRAAIQIFEMPFLLFEIERRMRAGLAPTARMRSGGVNGIGCEERGTSR